MLYLFNRAYYSGGKPKTIYTAAPSNAETSKAYVWDTRITHINKAELLLLWCLFYSIMFLLLFCFRTNHDKCKDHLNDHECWTSGIKYVLWFKISRYFSIVFRLMFVYVKGRLWQAFYSREYFSLWVNFWNVIFLWAHTLHIGYKTALEHLLCYYSGKQTHMITLWQAGHVVALYLVCCQSGTGY